MAGVSVVTNFNHLPQIAQKLPVRRRVSMQRRGEQMVQIARNRSRVDTGAMRDGWEWRESAQGGSLRNDTPYVSFHEYGTRYITSQAMARPAAEQVFPLIVHDFSDESMWLP